MLLGFAVVGKGQRQAHLRQVARMMAAPHYRRLGVPVLGFALLKDS